MITLFNRKEVYVTYSMGEQAGISQILSSNHINYKLKVVNNMSADTRSRMGSMGQDMDMAYEYIFYVHKDDYDKASYLVRP